MNYIKCRVPSAFSIKELYTAFSAVREANFRFAGEMHNFWEAVFVIEGRIGVCSENDMFLLERGDAILHSPMEFHSIWTEGAADATIAIISFQTNKPYQTNARIFSLPDNMVDQVMNIVNDVRAAYESMDYEIRGINPGMELEAELCVKQFEVFLLNMIHKYRKQKLVTKENRTKSARMFADAVYFLDQNVEYDLSVDEIAEKCSMSRSNLKKLFAKYSGMGVKQYFTMMKVRRGEEYLKSGMSVKECATKLGFCDQNYFSTVYKKYLGHTPSQTLRSLRK